MRYSLNYLTNKLLSSKLIYRFISKSEFKILIIFLDNSEFKVDYSYAVWKELNLYKKEKYFNKMLEIYKGKIKNNVLYHLYRFFKDLLWQLYTFRHILAN